MLKIALTRKPSFICRSEKEVTTEGGLNLKFNSKFIKEIINKLKKNKSE